MHQRRRHSNASSGQDPTPAVKGTPALGLEPLRERHGHTGSKNRVRSPRKLFRLETGRFLCFLALTRNSNRTVFRLAVDAAA
jgi:hypothetical protein